MRQKKFVKEVKKEEMKVHNVRDNFELRENNKNNLLNLKRKVEKVEVPTNFDENTVFFYFLHLILY
jgi:ferritin